jgi:peptide deformylase
MEYKLVYYGNETLKKIAERVMNIDGELIKLIESMYRVMYKSRGIGLAAPQVDVSQRLIVIDTREEDSGTLTLINPEIKEMSAETEPYEEGCLSLPDISADVIRPSRIVVSGITPDQKEIDIEADGLLARVLQHEIDHLNGIVFIDRLEKHERDEFRPELKRIKKLNRPR